MTTETNTWLGISSHLGLTLIHLRNPYDSSNQPETMFGTQFFRDKTIGKECLFCSCCFELEFWKILSFLRTYSLLYKEFLFFHESSRDPQRAHVESLRTPRVHTDLFFESPSFLGVLYPIC